MSRLVLLLVIIMGSLHAQNTAMPVAVRLSGPTTYYVDPSGVDDLWHGQSTGAGAWRTPAYAVKWVCANVDCAGYSIVIKVAPGFYTDQILLGDVERTASGGWPNKPLVIQGNVADPANGPELSINGYAAILAIGLNTAWEIEGFIIQSTICDVEADFGSKIYVANNIHGKPGNAYPSPQKLSAIYGGRIEILGDLWIEAGGDQIAAAIYQGMIIELGGTTIFAPPESWFTHGYCVDDPTSVITGISITN